MAKWVFPWYFLVVGFLLFQSHAVSADGSEYSYITYGGHTCCGLRLSSCQGYIVKRREHVNRLRCDGIVKKHLTLSCPVRIDVQFYTGIHVLLTYKRLTLTIYHVLFKRTLLY